MTSPFNLVPSCPVISVPTGFSSDGLPTGGQIVGRRFADETVLAVAKAFQVARPWPTPPLLGTATRSIAAEHGRRARSS